MLSSFKLGRLALLLSLAVTTTACRDDLGLDDWVAIPDTVTLYSMSRPELLGQPSAYDFINHLVMRVEALSAAGNWDVAVRDSGSSLVLAPAASFTGQTQSRAALAIVNRSFDELAEAPADTSQFSTAPVLLEPGQVMAVRTRRAPCAFSNSVRYAKLRILEVDAAAGTVKFESITNPFCNDRKLIPPED